MLTEKQIQQICQHLRLFEQALTLFKSIRSSDRSLRESIGDDNVRGFYPSRKMASSILLRAARLNYHLAIRPNMMAISRNSMISLLYY
jgi:hypothetical protein